MIGLDILGIGLRGPGLADWPAARAVLRGEAEWRHEPVPLPPPSLLAATERRRTSPAIRLALAVAAEACAASGQDASSLDSVFASSNGDGQVIGAILAALHEEGGALSPTQFHNSVHNAPAGYWGIAAQSQRASISVGGHDAIFATGLLQAAIQVAASRRPILFCASDAPMEGPLAAKRPTECPFGVALILAPGRHLRLAYVAEPADDPRPALGNACARALPLLTALAAGRAAQLRLGLLDDAHLRLELSAAPQALAPGPAA